MPLLGRKKIAKTRERLQRLYQWWSCWCFRTGGDCLKWRFPPIRKVLANYSHGVLGTEITFVCTCISVIHLQIALFIDYQMWNTRKGQMHSIICFCFALEITSNIEVRTDSRGFCLNVAKLDAFFPKQLHSISNTISSKGEVFFFQQRQDR